LRILDDMAQHGLLEPIDLHLGRLIARLCASQSGGRHEAELALIAALVSRERGLGHSCLDLNEIAGQLLVDAGAESRPLPDKETWERALGESPLVGDGSIVTPLVRDDAGRVYLYRYWAAERRVAEWIRARTAPATGDESGDDERGLATSFRRLFPAPDRGGDARQAMAAVLALGGALTVVSGGPGTGKTTTVTRILALLAGTRSDLRIAMAAPTGKAAARLTESVARESARLDVDECVRARIPTTASTVHRLLGAGGRTGGFRHDATRPIAADVVVIDEASMIDLLLMDALLAAVRPGARVVLLGDRNQLASVDTGFVFGDVCLAAERLRTASGYRPDVARRFERLAGYRFEDTGASAGSEPVPTADDRGGRLGQASVDLRTSYRFTGSSGIAVLAAAIAAGDSDGAVQALDRELAGEVAHTAHPRDPRDAVAPLHEAIADYLAADDTATALERMARFRILCATRVGVWGTHNLNRAVEARLERLGRATHDPWYAGRPILVTANDYQVGLFNGDVGVCWPETTDSSGRAGVSAWFATAAGGVRRVPIARLPAHETAWAMTVHKSQGSEFDRVLLVLPDRDSPVLTRELLYTAVTRVRSRIDIVGQDETFAAAVRRTAARRSGLLERLLST